ncbi:hypothetical protein [Streptosporangium sp. NPDC000509]|uniref:hypothetical protein n=1 Tax=Streptosporangium sp. NPDC000509 TaxID=3366186 RepID=UPI00369B8903
MKVSVGVVHKTLADAQRADVAVEQETPAEPIEKPTQATKPAQVSEVTAEPTPWERYGDPATRRRWYTDELTAVRLVATGDVDGASARCGGQPAALAGWADGVAARWEVAQARLRRSRNAVAHGGPVTSDITATLDQPVSVGVVAVTAAGR